MTLQTNFVVSILRYYSLRAYNGFQLKERGEGEGRYRGPQTFGVCSEVFSLLCFYIRLTALWCWAFLGSLQTPLLIMTFSTGKHTPTSNHT